MGSTDEAGFAAAAELAPADLDEAAVRVRAPPHRAHSTPSPRARALAVLTLARSAHAPGITLHAYRAPLHSHLYLHSPPSPPPPPPRRRPPSSAPCCSAGCARPPPSSPQRWRRRRPRPPLPPRRRPPPPRLPTCLLPSRRCVASAVAVCRSQVHAPTVEVRMLATLVLAIRCARLPSSAVSHRMATHSHAYVPFSLQF